MRTGLDQHSANGDDTNDEDVLKDALEQAQQQLETPGQYFRLKVMDTLFDSPFHTVECCL